MRVTRIALTTLALTSSAQTIARAATINVPAMTVTALTHTAQPGTAISDDASSRNATPPSLGAYTQSSFTTTVTGHDTFNFSIVAPAGQMFVYTPDPSTSTNSITLIADWLTDNASWYSNGPVTYAVTATFLTPSGPVAAQHILADTGGVTGQILRIAETITFSHPLPTSLEFTELDFSAPFNATIPSPASNDFTPTFFHFYAKASGADMTLLSLQPLPEPTALVPVLLATSLLRRSRRRR